MSNAVQVMIMVAMTTVVAFVLGFAVAQPEHPRDTTDPPVGRSELRLRVDYATGCEYLSTAFGGLTPRVDGHGTHLGCRT